MTYTVIGSIEDDYNSMIVMVFEASSIEEAARKWGEEVASDQEVYEPGYDIQVFEGEGVTVNLGVSIEPVFRPEVRK